ncbi:MAG: hypothetical protein AAGD96_19950, partial [Chloroflexota bacterium]
MSARKLVVNDTQYMVLVSFKVRKGDDPSNGVWGGAGMYVHAGKSGWLEYGSDENPYVNEISIKLNIGDHHYEHGVNVGTHRGNQADNELNMNNTVIVTF